MDTTEQLKFSAQFEVSEMHASSVGSLIERAREMYRANMDHPNILWVEALMTHLDTPIPARLTLDPSHPLYGQPMRIFIKSEDALAALDTMNLQPVDMRWNATGHERESLGTSNGIRGVVALAEIRNQNELWVAFAFWMNEFPEETQFFLENISAMGMSVDLRATDVYEHETIPNTAVFGGPSFRGGSILFAEIAADHQTLIGAIAEKGTTFNKESNMELKEILAILAEKDTKSAEALQAVVAAKDAQITSLTQRLELASTAAQAETATKIDEARAEAKTVAETALREVLEVEKTQAVATATAEVAGLKAQLEEQGKLVTELEAKLASAQAELTSIADAKKAEEEAVKATSVIAERLGVLNGIHPYTDVELTDEFKSGLATASETDFECEKLRRKVAKLEASPAGTSAGREIHGSVQAAIVKGTGEINDLAEITAKFARAI